MTVRTPRKTQMGASSQGSRATESTASTGRSQQRGAPDRRVDAVDHRHGFISRCAAPNGWQHRAPSDSGKSLYSALGGARDSTRADTSHQAHPFRGLTSGGRALVR